MFTAQTKMDSMGKLIQEQRCFEVSYAAEKKTSLNSDESIHFAMWDVQVLQLKINSNYFLQTQRTWFF